MTKANECTCPSGDGSLRHPCPVHPASVEQAGGDECAAFEAWWQSAEVLKCKRDVAMEAWQARAALAQPSQAQAEQAEQAEAERPEVVAWRYGFSGGIVSDKACLDEWKSGGEYQSLMTVAQHERIVGVLRAKIAQLRQHKNDYMDSGQQTYRALQNEIREREAEIARLDGLVSGRTAERDAALAEVKRIKTISDNYYALCVERQQQLDAALAMVSGLRSLLNPILCYVENDIERMRGDRDKSDNKETYDLAISLAMKRLKAAQHAVFTTEPGCNTAVELASHITAQAQHSVPEEVRTLLSRAQCEIEHLAECLENVCEDEEDFDVREDVADGRVVAADIAHMLAAAPGKEGL